MLVLPTWPTRLADGLELESVLLITMNPQANFRDAMRPVPCAMKSEAAVPPRRTTQPHAHPDAGVESRSTSADKLSTNRYYDGQYKDGVKNL